MKKLSGVLAIFLMLSLLTVPFLTVQAETTPLVLINDSTAVFWENLYSWTVTDDTTTYYVGSNALNTTVPASSQYSGISYDLSPFPFNATAYDYVSFWFYGNDSGYQWRISLDTDDSNFYYAYFTDDFSGWHWFNIAWTSGFNTNGSPDLEDITQITLTMGEDGDSQSVIWDYIIMSIGTPNPTPTPTPTPTAPPQDEYADSAVHIIMFYTIIAWLIASLIIGLKYWKQFSLFGGLVGVVLTLVIMSNSYFIIGQFYDETAQAIVNSYMAIGFLYWVPILLIVANLIMPFLKK